MSPESGATSAAPEVRCLAGAVVANDLAPRDSLAALGFVGATRDLEAATNRGGMLYVFALP